MTRRVWGLLLLGAALFTGAGILLAPVAQWRSVPAAALILLAGWAGDEAMRSHFAHRKTVALAETPPPFRLADTVQVRWSSPGAFSGRFGTVEDYIGDGRTAVWVRLTNGQREMFGVSELAQRGPQP